MKKIIHLYVKVNKEKSFCLDFIFYFIDLDRAITEKELIETTMERLTWWKCIIPVWCLVDDAQEGVEEQKKKNAETQKENAKKAEEQAFIDQCE